MQQHLEAFQYKLKVKEDQNDNQRENLLKQHEKISD